MCSTSNVQHNFLRNRNTMHTPTYNTEWKRPSQHIIPTTPQQHDEHTITDYLGNDVRDGQQHSPSATPPKPSTRLLLNCKWITEDDAAHETWIILIINTRTWLVQLFKLKYTVYAFIHAFGKTSVLFIVILTILTLSFDVHFIIHIIDFVYATVTHTHTPRAPPRRFIWLR